MIWDRGNWIEAAVDNHGVNQLATRHHAHRATNGDIPAGQQGSIMKETDRKVH